MSMEQPKFNPYDEKYKKVADLPIDKQKNFVDVEGGFITKEAARYDENKQRETDYENNGLGNVLRHLMGEKQYSKEYRIQQDAEDMNHRELSLAEKQASVEYNSARWKSFEKSVAINIDLRYTHVGSVLNARIFLINEKGEQSKEFIFDFNQLLREKILTPSQIVSIFEIDIKNGNPIFTGKFNEDGEKKLGEILGKEVVSIER